MNTNMNRVFTTLPDLLLSSPAIFMWCILGLSMVIKIWPEIANFARLHAAPYRSGIPGMALAAFITDLLFIGVCLILVGIYVLVIS